MYCNTANKMKLLVEYDRETHETNLVNRPSAHGSYQASVDGSENPARWVYLILQVWQRLSRHNQLLQPHCYK